jgi:predicted transcriptional regulator
VENPKELINRLLRSEVKAELLALFHNNPGLIDTADGVARRIGRTGEAIKKDIEDLAQIGLLQLKRYRDVEAISLNFDRDREIQQLIMDYIKSSTRKTSGE